MIKMDGMSIELSRGDCQPFTITLTGDDVPEDGEQVLFTVKKNAANKTPVIQKTLTIENGQILIEIMNADTKNLPFGDYEWDIRFPNIYGDGEPYTPMAPALFKIVRVVGDV